MITNLPEIGKPLDKEHIEFLKVFSKSCRHSILKMVVNGQSGHPGGSLSTIDYLSLVYTYIISQTGEDVVVSNGHISPAVYSVLGEIGYIPKEEAVENFRKIGSIYEGHITRHVNGITYGTGPLGIGGSVAYAFAHAEKMKGTNRKVFGIMGDGECEEGQVHEMLENAKHHNIDNLIIFIDYNKVQLTASLKDTMDLNIPKVFAGHEWEVIEVDGHDYQDMWRGIGEAYAVKGKPVVIVGNTIMGKGAGFIEKPGLEYNPEWHGKAPKPNTEGLKELFEQLKPTKEENDEIEKFRSKFQKWKPEKNDYPALLSALNINTGTPITYPADKIIDCRTAYGKALLDLAQNNKEIIALTADVKGSVMTKFVSEELPKQYVEVGIAEQHMVSAAGGFGFRGYIPFASTFGAFLSSRAKDQARVNDINHTNVKMVATHCGLSVGEDGPTHQAIDDMGSFLGMFDTMVIEPADPNQTDRIIRYIASHYGNFYVRMGRHKFPIITKEDGSVFYNENYTYEYGKTDIIRKGSDITIAATGATVNEALIAREKLKENNSNLSIEIVAVSSIKKFDETLTSSIQKTKKVITVEDHNTLSGLGGQIASHLQSNNIQIEKFKMIGVEKYQLSGKAPELYHKAGIDSDAIAQAYLEL